MTQDQAHMEMEKLANPKHRAYTQFKNWKLPTMYEEDEEVVKPFCVGICPTLERQFAPGYGNTWEEAIADFKTKNKLN